MSTILKTIVRLSTWLLILLAGVTHARSYDDMMTSGYITVGVYRDFPPYSFMDNGEAKGIDIDIGRRIAKAFDVEMRIHWITPDENLEDDLRNNVWKGHFLERKVADVMMRVPYDRAFRLKRDDVGLLANEQVVLFGPYHQEAWQVAYDSKKIDRVRTMAIFQYHSIGVETDSLPDTYLTSTMGGRLREKTRHYTNIGKAFGAMTAGKIDAVMGMRGEVDWWLFQSSNSQHKKEQHKKGQHKNAQYKNAQYKNAQYKIGENGFPSLGKQQWDIGMAVKHTYRQLSYAIEGEVEKMVNEGEMAKLFQQYGLQYKLPELYKAE